MQVHKASPGVVRFESFRLDLRAAELRHDTGRTTRLPEQPFQILTMLLAQPGVVVTREEIRQRLWPNGTVVEFEHSISAAMNRLRGALGDSAENPRFVETARRGYRFMVPVELEGPQALLSTLGPSGRTSSNESANGQPALEYGGSAALAGRRPQPTPEQTPTTRGNLWKLGVLGVGAAVATCFAWYKWQSGHSRLELTPRQLTSNPSEDWVMTSAISPDGKYLAYVDQTGLLARSLDSGETRPIFLPAEFASTQICSIVWFPEGGKLLVTLRTPEGYSLWVVTVLGQAPPQLLRRDAGWAAISPDGKSIAFVSGALYQWAQDLWVSGINGETPHKIGVARGSHTPSWSPDGKWIAYFNPESGRIEAQPTSGGASKVLVSAADLATPLVFTFSSCAYWAPDWRLIFEVADATSPPEQRQYSLWQIHISSAGLRPSHPPQQLTPLGESGVANLSATYDGKRLALLESRSHHDVYLAELQAGKMKTPRRFTLENHDSSPDLWTRDSQNILFVSNRNGKNELFKQGLNDNVPQKLESSTIADIGTSNGLTPDGKWLLFWENPPPSSEAEEHPQLPVRLMRQQIGGGLAEQVLEMPYAEGIDASLRCPFRPGNACVLGELGGKDKHNILFYILDPIHGKGDLLGSVQIAPKGYFGWALSPEGSQIGVVHHSHKDRIEVLNLSTRAWHAITVEPGWGDFQSVSWDAEGRGFFVTTVLFGSSFNLVHVTLFGKVQALLTNAQRQWIYQPLPSPDGRHLAFQAQTNDSNVWLLENF